MASSYWIKLYHEILRDPKMARLPDRVWRKTVELFLLAGEYEDEGNLPETKDIAWTLRVTPKSLERDLETIKSLGIIEETETGWLVTNFEKRNAPATGAERVRNFRETKRKKSGNENVTEVKRECNEGVTKSYIDTDTDKDTDKDTDTDTEKEKAAALVFKAYEREIGLITSVIADDIRDCLEDYPPEWFEAAFQESARQNKRNWRYALAILKRWKVQGFQSSNKPGAKPKYEKGYKPNVETGEMIPTWTDENGVEYLSDPTKVAA